MPHTPPPGSPPALSSPALSSSATSSSATPATATPALPPLPFGLETTAQRYAVMERQEAERLIDAEVLVAIREWRVADATFWQRVRYRSRMIRAADAHRRTAAGRA